MAATSTTSLRGQTTKYFFSRGTDLNLFSRPEGSFTKDADVLDTDETETPAIVITSCLAGNFWSYNYDPSGDDEMLCMTYNPITDHYAIREGEYVL
jgi:hypothetical protein